MTGQEKNIDLLREEYNSLLPEMRKANIYLETKIRWYLRDITFNLKKHARLEIKSRIKECDSAINKLFNKGKTEGSSSTVIHHNYELKSLHDLVGIRISVFPDSLIDTINHALNKKLINWTPHHRLSEDKSTIVAYKYYGYINKQKNRKIKCEAQILSMLTSPFWDIEHDTLYKPSTELSLLKNNLDMQAAKQEVLDALKNYGQTFENLLSEYKKQINENKL